MAPTDDRDENGGTDRRAFLKRMAAVGFAVPVVTSFSMLHATPAFAGSFCSGGGGNVTCDV